MELKVKKLHPDAQLPEYATDGSGCFDIRTIEQGAVLPDRDRTFRTGLAVEIPEGHVMLIFSRSGHGFKNDTRLSNCVGVIDSDYRGQIQVKLRCDSEYGGILVDAGDRIAQAIILPFPRVSFVEVDELSDTERGTGGFGSTGSA